MKRVRFDEKAYVFNRIKGDSLYITDDDIESMLNGHLWDDLTFIVTPTSTGFKTKIIDNNSDEEISMEEINGFALEFYMSILKVQAVQDTPRTEENIAAAQIQMIWEILDKHKEQTDQKGKSKKRKLQIAQ
jgi:hypothetical protein